MLQFTLSRKILLQTQIPVSLAVQAFDGTLAGDRTRDPALRRRVLYPLSYEGIFTFWGNVQVHLGGGYSIP